MRIADFFGLLTLKFVSEQTRWQVLQPEHLRPSTIIGLFILHLPVPYGKNFCFLLVLIYFGVQQSQFSPNRVPGSLHGDQFTITTEQLKQFLPGPWSADARLPQKYRAPQSESDALDCATAVCAAGQVMGELFGSGQVSETHLLSVRDFC